jgi:cytoskeletal protein RodZ
MSTFGEELRRERELRQIPLRDVSQATKINMRYLEALERNDFSHLPGGVFNRGFVRAYCQFIGVDSEAMVNAYILEEQAQSEARGGARESGLLRGRGRGRREEEEEGKLPTVHHRAWFRWGGVVLAAAVIAGSVYLYLRFTG